MSSGTSPKQPRFTSQKRPGNVAWVIVCAIVILGIGSTGGWYLLRSGPENGEDQPLLHTVEMGPFDHVVLEQGEVESSNNVEVTCEVKSRSMGSGGVAILWVVDEGTTVEKGEPLVTLDSSVLENDLKQQRIVVNSSHALKISAEALLQQAMYAKQEYLEGTFKTEEKAILSEIAIAEQDLRKAQLSLQSGERLAAKGLVTSLQLEADQFAVQNALNQLDAAQGRLKVLRDLTKKKMLVQYESDIETAKARVDSETKSYQEELDKQADLEDQITKCEIFAPQDGQVVHANRFSSRGGSAEFVVEPGAVVRERQAIIRLPDRNNMQVKAKINESQIQLVKTGMPVTIKVGASVEGVLGGTVKKVNQYSEPTSWFSSQVKEYAAFITINNPSETIRTGMTAEVRILVNHFDNVLQIPVQGVYEHRDHLFCLVKNGERWETREIKMGASNDEAVTIKEGLSVDDQVVLNPRRHVDLMQLPELPDEMKGDSDAFKRFQKENGNSADGDKKQPGNNPSEGKRPDGPPSGSGRPSPAAIVTRIFDSSDSDKDGKLSQDEINQMSERSRGTAGQADANGDGFVDRAELTAALAKRFQQGSGGQGGSGP